MEEHQLDQSTACAASAVMLDKQRSVEVLRRWGSNSTFGSCIHLFAEELSLFKKGFCFLLSIEFLSTILISHTHTQPEMELDTVHACSFAMSHKNNI